MTAKRGPRKEGPEKETGRPRPPKRRTPRKTVVRRGRPRRTDAPGPTRAEVIAAVVRLAEENGDTGINMRDLARTLGVSPKLLYRHVSGKDELLNLAAAAISESWELPPASLPWDERLTEIMIGTRALVRRFPALSQAILLQNLKSRDTPEVARVVDAIIGCFEEAGLTAAEANEVFFLYKAMIWGELAISRAVREGALPADSVPGGNLADAGFDMGLRYLITGITAGRDQGKAEARPAPGGKRKKTSVS